MPASYNVHPEFGFLCPTPRFRRQVRLVLAGFVSTASTTASAKQVATPKKAKKTASRHAPRRDPYWYGAPSWREVEYQRGGYGRGGFTPNFW